MDDSFDPETYAAQAAALLGIALDDEARAGVAVHLQRTAEAAQLVLDFELPPELDPAPLFKP